MILGYQDPDIDDLECESPTLSTTSRTLIFMLAANQKWKLKSGDVKTAFMQGDEEQRLIYGEVPDDVRDMLGLRDDEIVRLKKAGYGLVNAPWKWFKKVEETLLGLGWKQHPLGVCLFMKYNENDELVGVMGVHVDDVLTCGYGKEYLDDLQTISRKFKWGHWHEDDFTY